MNERIKSDKTIEWVSHNREGEYGENNDTLRPLRTWAIDRSAQIITGPLWGSTVSPPNIRDLFIMATWLTRYVLTGEIPTSTAQANEKIVPPVATVKKPSTSRREPNNCADFDSIKGGGACFDWACSGNGSEQCQSCHHLIRPRT